MKIISKLTEKKEEIESWQIDSDVLHQNKEKKDIHKKNWVLAK